MALVLLSLSFSHQCRSTCSCGFRLLKDLVLSHASVLLPWKTPVFFFFFFFHVPAVAMACVVRVLLGGANRTHSRVRRSTRLRKR